MDKKRALKIVVDWCLLHGDAPTQEASRFLESLPEEKTVSPVSECIDRCISFKSGDSILLDGKPYVLGIESVAIDTKKKKVTK